MSEDVFLDELQPMVGGVAETLEAQRGLVKHLRGFIQSGRDPDETACTNAVDSPAETS